MKMKIKVKYKIKFVSHFSRLNIAPEKNKSCIEICKNIFNSQKLTWFEFMTNERKKTKHVTFFAIFML